MNADSSVSSFHRLWRLIFPCQMTGAEDNARLYGLLLYTTSPSKESNWLSLFKDCCFSNLNNFKYKQFIPIFMNIKEFIKPSIFKTLVFLLITILSLYFTRENACGVSLFFAFCYNAYGFPFLYIVTGQIDTASGYIKTLPLGNYFSQYGNFLFNIPAFLLDVVLIYLAACFIFVLFRKIKFKHWI